MEVNPMVIKSYLVDASKPTREGMKALNFFNKVATNGKENRDILEKGYAKLVGKNPTEADLAVLNGHKPGSLLKMDFNENVSDNVEEMLNSFGIKFEAIG